MPSSPDYHPDREDLIQFASTFPFFNLMGLELVDAQPGSSLTRLAWRKDLCQPAGILHGGVIATLIDTGIAHAIMLTPTFRELAQQGGRLVSVDLRIRYFRPVSQGFIECKTTIPRLGRQIIHGESIVTDEAGKEVARGESIYMTVATEQLKAKTS
jgi:uncharacterized protein (TIGR00369 family)